MMNHDLVRSRALLSILVFVLLAALLSGCGTFRLSGEVRDDPPDPGFPPWSGASRYCQNRLYDFTDIFQLGAGVVSHDPESGIWPPLVGVYLQFTEFFKGGCNLLKLIGLQFDAFTYYGHSVEWDGRGFFAGRERRSRLAMGRWEMLHIEQYYDESYENYFKKSDTAWTTRMTGPDMMWRNTPAKELNYEFWADGFRLGLPPFHRGWQHWANTCFEVGIYPFTLRAGVDWTEPIDFILGFFFIDYKRDDLTPNEWKEKRIRGPHLEGDIEPKPAADS